MTRNQYRDLFSYKTYKWTLESKQPSPLSAIILEVKLKVLHKIIVN